MAYKHLLVAVDLTEESPHVIQQACELANLYQAKVSLINILEPVSLAFGGDIPMDLSTLQQEQLQNARERLDFYIADYPSLTSEHCYLCYGQPRQEIHRIAEENGCDLIVVGSHGRHGLALLLGSTTKDLLQNAPCDILAIALHQKDKND